MAISRGLLGYLQGCLLAICLWQSSFVAIAQTTETINSDRPGQAINPLVVGRGMFQIQTGITLADFRDQSLSETESKGNSFQYTISPRLGLTDRLEINSVIALRRDNIESLDEEIILDGLSTLIFGTRYTFLKGSDFSPSLALQFDVSLTAVADDYLPERASPRLLVTHSQYLFEWMALTTNVGIVWNGNGRDRVGVYVLNLSFPLSENINYFIEAYANSTSGDFDINFDTGLGYLLNNDLQLDLSAGYGENDNFKDWFIDAGVSWRFQVNGHH